MFVITAGDEMHKRGAASFGCALRRPRGLRGAAERPAPHCGAGGRRCGLSGAEVAETAEGNSNSRGCVLQPSLNLTSSLDFILLFPKAASTPSAHVPPFARSVQRVHREFGRGGPDHLPAARHGGCVVLPGPLDLRDVRAVPVSWSSKLGPWGLLQGSTALAATAHKWKNCRAPIGTLPLQRQLLHRGSEANLSPSFVLCWQRVLNPLLLSVLAIKQSKVTPGEIEKLDL
ncbi:Protein of unknown function [Gryllus bimaculatus]|nr:Protein of unknown function [Gryllus bimaculatus]